MAGAAAGSAAGPAVRPLLAPAVQLDHPAYMRPISSTKNFYVKGRPKSVCVAVAKDCGCVGHVLSVHVGKGAAAEAEASVAAFKATDKENWSSCCAMEVRLEN